jgi:hypothetical protein
VAVLPGDPGRIRTCNSPIKSRQLCRLSYGAVGVVGRARTCNAPRFRRALYLLELRPRGWARLGSNQRPLVCKTSAHPAELLARVEHKWAELESNQRPPPYERRSASRATRPSSGTRTRTSISTFRAWCPSVRRSQIGTSALPSTSRAREIDATAKTISVTLGLCRTMFSKPLAYSSTLDRARSASYVEELWSPSLTVISQKERAKAHASFPAQFSAPTGEGLSLSGGASISFYRLFKLSITSGSVAVDRLQKRRRRPVGSPSTGLLCG